MRLSSLFERKNTSLKLTIHSPYNVCKIVVWDSLPAKYYLLTFINNLNNLQSTFETLYLKYCPFSITIPF